MPPNGSPDIFVDGSPASHRTSAAMAGVVIVAVLASCLLQSPSRFSAVQEQDHSPLGYVVHVLGLGAAFPTARGVELRNLIFVIGATLLTLIAAWRMIFAGARPRLAIDDLLEVRDRAKGPYFWWVLLLAASIVSSMSSHAPEVCEGQTIVRFIQAAWWWPLALMLAPVHVPAVAAGLVGSLSIMSAIGLWYHFARVIPVMPDARLQYPIGNELWLAACLLPGLFIAIGLTKFRRACSPSQPNPQFAIRNPQSSLPMVLLTIAFAVIVIALYLTRSRSAFAGLCAGIVTCIVITLRGKPRKLVLLVSLILAIGAVGYVQRLRESGSVALRAPSIRARLNYEWPYAINLFMQKPVGGHGDGAYALLAGGFARDDQLEDPRVLANEDRSWLGHPHNEFLELLADLGLAGALGFALALAVTFFRAVKAGDAMIGSLEDTSRRRLIIALAGGLAAVVIEECSSVALREPGLPPIFLTVWAALWALVRPQRSLPMPTSGQRIFPAATFAVVGVAVVAGAGAIAYVGVNDWRGALAYQRGQVQMARQDYKEAAASADFAAERLLDPFRNSSARLSAIWSRSLWFDSILSRADSAPDDSALSVARDALMRLGQLNAIAPRFLGASRREWELCGNLEKAMVGRGKPNDARDAHARFVRALEQNRADEPFQIELVERLWSAKPGGPATEKLTWLRALLRGGEADDRFRSLLRTLGSQPDASAALAGLLDIAQRDAGHKTDRWSDSLSPETLRIAALVMPGGPAQAIKIVEQADAMYTLAGPRLFAAHAAALHEIVQFRFAIDPTANVDMNLSQLARADEMIEGASSPDKSLPGPKGQTRLRILLAAGKDDAARRQLAVLPAEPGATEASRLAAAYESLAMMFAHSHPDLAQQWRDRANQLHPSP